MGKVQDYIDEDMKSWIAEQHMFFVASAPLDAEGHVNCSPKGMDSFRVLDKQTVVYMDLTGSGAETIAHISENQRLVIMFCAFDGKPQIVRLYGKAQFHVAGSQRFAELQSSFPASTGTRSFIELSVSRVSYSCGFSVPLYSYEGQRTVLNDWFEQTGAEKLAAYRCEANAESIDGLPALAADSSK